MRRRLFAVVLCMLVLCRTVWAERVLDEATANKLFADARAQIAVLGLTIPRDILLKFRTRDELMTENNGHGGRTIELNGFYRPYDPESIWVVSGLERNETEATMAHELTHAWQSTESPLQDRKLTEGFARWVEYHVLKNLGDDEAALRLTKDRDPDYGGGLRFLLDLEEKQGSAAVINYARTEKEIP